MKRVAYVRELAAGGHRPAVVARILQISCQAIYRLPKRMSASARRSQPPACEVAEQNPTDGYRIVTTWVRRRLGRAVNHKRVLRVMREQRLIGRRAHEPRPRRPRFFRVERPGRLWHLDMKRHEALLDRALVKGHRGQLVAAGW